MIYRLTTGARSEWKKYLLSGLLVFMITAGFPILGAWFNYENLTLRPSEIVQDDPSGEVLGESTSQNDPNADPPTPPSQTSRRVTVSQMKSQPPITVLPQPQAPTIPATPPAPAAPAPVPAVTLPEPPSPSPDPVIDLEVDVLDVVEGEVTVTPEAPPVLEAVGL